MPSAEFEPEIPEIERPQTYALDRKAIRMGGFSHVNLIFLKTYFRLTAACFTNQLIRFKIQN